MSHSGSILRRNRYPKVKPDGGLNAQGSWQAQDLSVPSPTATPVSSGQPPQPGAHSVHDYQQQQQQVQQHYNHNMSPYNSNNNNNPNVINHNNNNNNSHSGNSNPYLYQTTTHNNSNMMMPGPTTAAAAATGHVYNNGATHNANRGGQNSSGPDGQSATSANDEWGAWGDQNEAWRWNNIAGGDSSGGNFAPNAATTTSLNHHSSAAQKQTGPYQQSHNMPTIQQTQTMHNHNQSLPTGYQHQQTHPGNFQSSQQLHQPQQQQQQPQQTYAQHRSQQQTTQTTSSLDEQNQQQPTAQQTQFDSNNHNAMAAADTQSQNVQDGGWTDWGDQGWGNWDNTGSNRATPQLQANSQYQQESTGNMAGYYEQQQQQQQTQSTPGQSSYMPATNNYGQDQQQQHSSYAPSGGTYDSYQQNQSQEYNPSEQSYSMNNSTAAPYPPSSSSEVQYPPGSSSAMQFSQSSMPTGSSYQQNAPPGMVYPQTSTPGPQYPQSSTPHQQYVSDSISVQGDQQQQQQQYQFQGAPSSLQYPAQGDVAPPVTDERRMSEGSISISGASSHEQQHLQQEQQRQHQQQQQHQQQEQQQHYQQQEPERQERTNFEQGSYAQQTTQDGHQYQYECQATSVGQELQQQHQQQEQQQQQYQQHPHFQPQDRQGVHETSVKNSQLDNVEQGQDSNASLRTAETVEMETVPLTQTDKPVDLSNKGGPSGSEPEDADVRGLAYRPIEDHNSGGPDEPISDGWDTLEDNMEGLSLRDNESKRGDGPTRPADPSPSDQKAFEEDRASSEGLRSRQSSASERDTGLAQTGGLPSMSEVLQAKNNNIRQEQCQVTDVDSHVTHAVVSTPHDRPVVHEAALHQLPLSEPHPSSVPAAAAVDQLPERKDVPGAAADDDERTTYFAGIEFVRPVSDGAPADQSAFQRVPYLGSSPTSLAAISTMPICGSETKDVSESGESHGTSELDSREPSVVREVIGQRASAERSAPAGGLSAAEVRQSPLGGEGADPGDQRDAAIVQTSLSRQTGLVSNVATRDDVAGSRGGPTDRQSDRDDFETTRGLERTEPSGSGQPSPSELQASATAESTREEGRPLSRRSARGSSSSSGDSEVAEHNREVLQQKVKARERELPSKGKDVSSSRRRDHREGRRGGDWDERERDRERDRRKEIAYYSDESEVRRHRKHRDSERRSRESDGERSRRKYLSDRDNDGDYDPYYDQRSRRRGDDRRRRDSDETEYSEFSTVGGGSGKYVPSLDGGRYRSGDEESSRYRGRKSDSRRRHDQGYTEDETDLDYHRRSGRRRDEPRDYYRRDGRRPDHGRGYGGYDSRPLSRGSSFADSFVSSHMVSDSELSIVDHNRHNRNRRDVHYERHPAMGQASVHLARVGPPSAGLGYPGHGANGHHLTGGLVHPAMAATAMNVPVQTPHHAGTIGAGGNSAQAMMSGSGLLSALTNGQDPEYVKQAYETDPDYRYVLDDYFARCTDQGYDMREVQAYICGGVKGTQSQTLLNDTLASTSFSDSTRLDGSSLLMPAEPAAPEELRKFSRPHAFARFVSLNTLIKIHPSTLSVDSKPPQLEMHDLKLILEGEPESKELGKFPGPLVRAETHKNHVIHFCNQRINSVRKNRLPMVNDQLIVDRESYVLLWELLVLLLRQNGHVTGTDIAELLLKDAPYVDPASVQRLAEEDMSQVENSDDAANSDDSQTTLDSTRLNRRALQQRRSGGLSPEQALAKFRELLLFGHRREAIEHAVRYELWGHAFCLASKLDMKVYTHVHTKFYQSMAGNDPLQTVYQLYSGRQPMSVSCVGDVAWGDWRPHLAMILSNPSIKPENDARSIITMGDVLLSRGCLCAAHFCYLMAQVEFGEFRDKSCKLVLLGSSHLQAFGTFATNEAIMCTEIYEYAQSLSNPGYALPSLAPYKFLHSKRLVDQGFVQEALAYCERLAHDLVRNPAAYKAQLVFEVYALGAKLKFNDVHYSQGSGEYEELGDPEWLLRLEQLCNAIRNGDILEGTPRSTPAHSHSDRTQIAADTHGGTGSSVGGTNGVGVSGETVDSSAQQQQQVPYNEPAVYNGSNIYGQQHPNQAAHQQQIQPNLYTAQQTQAGPAAIPGGYQTQHSQDGSVPNPRQAESAHEMKPQTTEIDGSTAPHLQQQQQQHNYNYYQDDAASNRSSPSYELNDEFDKDGSPIDSVQSYTEEMDGPETTSADDTQDYYEQGDRANQQVENEQEDYNSAAHKHYQRFLQFQQEQQKLLQQQQQQPCTDRAVSRDPLRECQHPLLTQERQPNQALLLTEDVQKVPNTEFSSASNESDMIENAGRFGATRATEVRRTQTEGSSYPSQAGIRFRGRNDQLSSTATTAVYESKPELTQPTPVSGSRHSVSSERDPKPKDCTADPNLWARVWRLQQQTPVETANKDDDGQDKAGCVTRLSREVISGEDDSGSPTTSTKLCQQSSVLQGSPACSRTTTASERPLKSALKNRRSSADSDVSIPAAVTGVSRKVVTKSVSYDDTVTENDGGVSTLKDDELPQPSQASSEPYLTYALTKRSIARAWSSPSGRDTEPNAYSRLGESVFKRSSPMAKMDKLVFRGTYPIDVPISGLAKRVHPSSGSESAI